MRVARRIVAASMPKLASVRPADKLSIVVTWSSWGWTGGGRGERTGRGGAQRVIAGHAGGRGRQHRTVETSRGGAVVGRGDELSARRRRGLHGGRSGGAQPLRRYRRSAHLDVGGQHPDGRCVLGDPRPARRHRARRRAARLGPNGCRASHGGALRKRRAIRSRGSGSATDPRVVGQERSSGSDRTQGQGRQVRQRADGTAPPPVLRAPARGRRPP